jgi:hypothetical protein
VGRELGARLTDTDLNLVITTRRGRYPESVVKLSKASISKSHVAETVRHSIISRDLGKTLGLINPCEVSSLRFILSKFSGERRNPFRAARLGLRAGVIFFCRVTAAMKMNLSDTFHRHAQDCQRMAASARHSVDKATWSQMARWCLACAEHYENQQAALDSRARDHNRRTYRRRAQTRGSDLAHR